MWERECVQISCIARCGGKKRSFFYFDLTLTPGKKMSQHTNNQRSREEGGQSDPPVARGSIFSALRDNIEHTNTIHTDLKDTSRRVAKVERQVKSLEKEVLSKLEEFSYPLLQDGDQYPRGGTPSPPHTRPRATQKARKPPRARMQPPNSPTQVDSQLGEEQYESPPPPKRRAVPGRSRPPSPPPSPSDSTTTTLTQTTSSGEKSH